MVLEGENMSSKEIEGLIFFFMALNLALIVVNHVAIKAETDTTPAVYLNTGQINPFITFSDPLGPLISTLNYTEQSLKNPISNDSNEVTYTYSLLNFVTYPWTIKLDSTVLGFPVGKLFSIIGLLAIIAVTGINLFIALAILFIEIGLGITLGAIPFWTSLFSMIDPILGMYLGIAIGALQMVAFGWYIFDYVANIISGGAEKVPGV